MSDYLTLNRRNSLKNQKHFGLKLNNIHSINKTSSLHISAYKNNYTYSYGNNDNLEFVMNAFDKTLKDMKKSFNPLSSSKVYISEL